MTIDQALKYAGGRQTHLAALLGVTGQVVNQWVKRGAISPLAQYELEYVSHGYLKADKRPHIVAMKRKLATRL